MTGTASQIEWAEQIRPRVGAEFDRVAEAFRTAADGQAEADRGDTLEILEIITDHRNVAMANERAGYFIRNWQEITDQVRVGIAADDRFRAIRARRELRDRERV